MRVKSFNLVKYVLLLAALVCSAASMYAQRVTDHREVSKSVSMSIGDELHIESKHSNINVRHWDRNQVKFELNMEATGKSERDVSRLLEAIHFDVDETSEGISVEAWMGPFSKMNSWDDVSEFVLKNGTKIGGIYKYSLDIDVYMPTESVLKVEHAFGNLTLKDLHQGDMYLESKHGNITMGDACCPAVMELQHANLSMGDANELVLELKHSNANVGNAEELSLEIQHSNLDLGGVDELSTEAHHSNLSIGKIRRLRFGNYHSNLEIQRLVRSLESESNHGSIKIKSLDSNFDEIDVELNYGNIEIDTDGAGFRMDYSGQHGSLEVVDGFRVDRKNQDEHGHYKEILGHKGSGDGVIKIKSLHGHVVVE